MEEKLLDILEDICGDEIVKENHDINLDYTELLIAIEENFGVVIAPSEVTREQMNTPNKIIGVIKSKM